MFSYQNTQAVEVWPERVSPSSTSLRCRLASGYWIHWEKTSISQNSDRESLDRNLSRVVSSYCGIFMKIKQSFALQHTRQTLSDCGVSTSERWRSPGRRPVPMCVVTADETEETPLPGFTETTNRRLRFQTPVGKTPSCPPS